MPAQTGLSKRSFGQNLPRAAPVSLAKDAVELGVTAEAIDYFYTHEVLAWTASLYAQGSDRTPL